MAVLANSITPVYSIETVITQSTALPQSYAADTIIPQTNLIYSNQLMPMVLVEGRLGPESDRQSWS